MPIPPEAAKPDPEDEHPEDALQFLDAMVLSRLAPDVFSFNGAISSCSKSSQGQHAMRLFEAMPAAKVQPDATGIIL
eukprot:Skav217283  [mRNA]  locus=scaffold120:225748:228531:+ [translate_table: standard]